MLLFSFTIVKGVSELEKQGTSQTNRFGFFNLIKSYQSRSFLPRLFPPTWEISKMKVLLCKMFKLSQLSFVYFKLIGDNTKPLGI